MNDIDYPPLSVTMRGVVPQLETAAKSDDHENRKMVKVGDFAINSCSDRRGSCGISAYDGLVSLINTVLEPREAMSPSYYNMLFHTSEFADEFYKWGHGIVDDLWTTRWADMKAMKVLLPSLEEQQRIADYLDERCQEIDAVKKTLTDEIEALQRLRKATIHKAVTKGLDESAPVKGSGVEWIGKLPESWKCIPFKSLCDFGKGIQYNKADLVDEGFPIISYGQVHSKAHKGTGLVDGLFRYADVNVANINRQSVVGKGSFLFAATSEDVESLGNCVLIDSDIDVLAGTDTIIARNFRDCLSKYLAYLVKTDCWRDQFRRDAIEVKVYHLNATKLRRTSVLKPPLAEQQQIADFLDKRCAAIDSIIDTRTKQLERLEDYRKALIFAYVTGKKEVPANE